MIRQRPNDKRLSALAVSGVDQKIRDSIQNLWLALPKDEANFENLEKHFLRLTNRALNDLKEDMDFFPPVEEH